MSCILGLSSNFAPFSDVCHMQRVHLLGDLCSWVTYVLVSQLFMGGCASLLRCEIFIYFRDFPLSNTNRDVTHSKHCVFVGINKYIMIVTIF
jgi:hypothetical protein